MARRDWARATGMVLLAVCVAGTAAADAHRQAQPTDAVVTSVDSDAKAEDVSVISPSEWSEPSPEMRPEGRWWWPGGAVEPERLRAHLKQIHDAGFGSVELQPLLLGIGEEDLAADARLRTVGTPAFRKLVSLAATAAIDVGLAFDFTLSSGWPGGLPTAKPNAERQLLMGTLDITGQQRFEGALPAAPDQSYRRAVEWVLDVLGAPDPDVALIAVLAGRLGAERDGVPTLEDVRVISGSASEGHLAWDVPEGDWRIFALYENSTLHFVMGGAFPGAEADAVVVDHLATRGADALLEEYAAPVLDAAPPGSVRDVFVDSLELMGELPFTTDFLEAFESEKGYDLTPDLPLVFRNGGESKYGEMMDFLGRTGGPLYRSPADERGDRVREDYEAVRAKLFEERFIVHIADWAHRRGLGLRLQAHGGYADYLDVYARSDVPEAEALFGNGSFDFLKLASSAAHVADRRWASSESFITLRFFGTRLSEQEMYLLAGRAYSAGINRLVYHGIPYPYTRVNGKRWFPFSGGFGRILAGPLPMSSEVDLEFLAELPEFNRFLSRLTLAMSRGEPVADVAWLRSDPIYPDTASMQWGKVELHAGESPETRALRARGLVHDRVSRRMLANAIAREGEFTIGARQYRALLLDPLEIADPEVVESIAAIAEAGIPVISLGALPRRARGLADAKGRDARVRAAVKRLAKVIVRMEPDARLEDVLARRVHNTLVEPAPETHLAISLDRRRNNAGETLLLVNESWSSDEARLRFVRSGGRLSLWNPRLGSYQILSESVEAGETITIGLEAAESLVLTLQNDRGTPR